MSDSNHVRPRIAVLVRLVPKKLGSLEEWLVRFVEALAIQYDVRVATYAPCHVEVQERLAKAGASWFDLAHVERDFITARRWLSENADVAHFSLFAPRARIVLAAQSLRGLTCVFQDCHSSPAEAGGSSFWSRLADRVTLRGFAKVVAVSSFVARRLKQRFRLSDSVVGVIYNGVEHSRFASIAKPQEAPTIVCVAALIADKGVDVLIRAFALVVDDPKRREKLVICGDGPSRAALERLAADLQVSGRVDFLGLRDDVPAILSSCCVAVHPAIWGEAFGLTIVEAMAAGKPIVASRVGAIPELVLHEKSGFLFSPGDHEELAQILIRLLDDEDLRSEVGQNARERAEEFFSMRAWIDQHVTLINDLTRTF